MTCLLPSHWLAGFSFLADMKLRYFRERSHPPSVNSTPVAHVVAAPSRVYHCQDNQPVRLTRATTARPVKRPAVAAGAVTRAGVSPSKNNPRTGPFVKEVRAKAWSTTREGRPTAPQATPIWTEPHHNVSHRAPSRTAASTDSRYATVARNR